MSGCTPQKACRDRCTRGIASLLPGTSRATAWGYVSIEQQGERLVHLQKIYVCPDKQRLHAGRALIEKAFDEAKRLFPDGHGRVELNVNRKNPALSFYRHMGMTIASSGDFDIGNGYFMNDYIMAIDF